MYETLSEVSKTELFELLEDILIVAMRDIKQYDRVVLLNIYRNYSKMCTGNFIKNSGIVEFYKEL